MRDCSQSSMIMCMLDRKNIVYNTNVVYNTNIVYNTNVVCVTNRRRIRHKYKISKSICRNHRQDELHKKKGRNVLIYSVS